MQLRRARSAMQYLRMNMQAPGRAERQATSRNGREPTAALPRNVRAWAAVTSRRLRRLQDRLLHLLGSSGDGRSKLVAGKLEHNHNEVTSYWLQLVVSIGIATLGLVVGSAAVIIGAMLVAPLMGPIVSLAMGLAAGSPFLVLRSATRIAFSVLLAIGGAALITVLLPFHELNDEIAARTSPTVLDLLTAGFCALAGVYASLRPGSDTATTAAGTSIGISLVPPLCASGYGLGTGLWPVAAGAALLFLTNLVAIIFVGSLAFLASGFNRVDTTVLERDQLDKLRDAPVTAAVARRLAGLFESKAGPLLRFLMPFVLLAVVYLPLRSALDEVAWQVQVRAAVQESIDREPLKIVESRVRVERRQVELLLVVLGKAADAEASRVRLDRRLRKASGIVPHIEVHAIPDAKALAGLESTLRMPKDPLPLPAPPPPPPAEQIEHSHALVRSHVTQLWPAATAGAALAIEIGTEVEGPIRVRVVHLGPALGADGIEGLARSLGTALQRGVQVIDSAIPDQPLTRAAGDLGFVSAVTDGIRASVSAAEVGVCVVQPATPAKPKRSDVRADELAAALRAALASHPRVAVESGEDWSVRFVRGACRSPASSQAAFDEAAVAQ